MSNNKREIRVGLFCDSLPPVLDGVSRVLLNYIEELDRRKTPTYVVGPNIKGARELFPCENLLLPAIKPKFSDPYPITLPFESKYVSRKMASFQPTIIHAHSPFAFGRAAYITAKKLNLPSVATLHSRYRDDIYDKTGSKLITNYMVKKMVRCYSQFTEVWALNPGVADELHSYGYKGKITIVGNATEFKRATPQELVALRKSGRTSFGIVPESSGSVGSESFAISGSDGSTSSKGSDFSGLTWESIPILLFVGQHRKGKGVFTILKALHSLVQQEPTLPWKMIFVGEGPDKKEMEQFITAKGLEKRVSLLGNISDRERIREIYASSDLFLFPSSYDCDPIVPREAAAMGTPSILLKDSYATSSNLYTHDKTAFLIEESPDALAREISRVLQDKPLLERVSAQAMAEIPRTWEVAINEVEDHYRRVIQEFYT